MRRAVYHKNYGIGTYVMVPPQLANLTQEEHKIILALAKSASKNPHWLGARHLLVTPQIPHIEPRAVHDHLLQVAP